MNGVTKTCTHQYYIDYNVRHFQWAASRDTTPLQPPQPPTPTPIHTLFWI